MKIDCAEIFTLPGLYDLIAVIFSVGYSLQFGKSGL